MPLRDLILPSRICIPQKLFGSRSISPQVRSWGWLHRTPDVRSQTRPSPYFSLSSSPSFRTRSRSSSCLRSSCGLVKESTSCPYRGMAEADSEIGLDSSGAHFEAWGLNERRITAFARYIIPLRWTCALSITHLRPPGAR